MQNKDYPIEVRVDNPPKLPEFYHTSHERWSGNFGYNPLLQRGYEKALELMVTNRKRPLYKPTPRVLLSGTASSFTTITFIRLIRGLNPNAQITIMDISNAPLESSRRRLSESPDIPSEGIRLVQADATDTGFQDGEFDWIETDFFLQFFSGEMKEKLIAEWNRILAKDGVITTKDWIVDPENNRLDKLFNKIRLAVYKILYKFDLQTASEQQLRALFDREGLVADITSDTRNVLLSLFARQIIAYRNGDRLC